MIAALFVQRGGAYWDLPGVDPWDEARDARRYAGPWPVVAHPPCSRWCRLAGLVEARWGHRRGEDGGCFAAALAAVRRWGGVLEHPAFSDAWAAHDLNAPPSGGGWVNADLLGGWTCYVEQGRYGHRARKATWLFAAGGELPALRWGMATGEASAIVGWAGNHAPSTAPSATYRPPVSWCGPLRMPTKDGGKRAPAGEARARLGAKAAAASPPAFRDELLAIARRVRSGPVSRLGHRARDATPEPFRDELLTIAGRRT